MDPAWAARFEIELARIYLYQGRSNDVSPLLQTPPPPGVESYLLVRRDLLLAVSQERLGNRQLAANALRDAEELNPQGSARAEMDGFKGVIALGHGNTNDAERLFRVALQEAQQQQADFLETQMWMNLGVAALQLQHYEDALERFHHASDLAAKIGAQLALEKALGNLGWTYYQTGDFARALNSAEAAEKQAAAIGALLDQVEWSRNAGMSQFQANDLVAARHSFERSLALAEQLKNTEDIISVHIALVYTLLHSDPHGAEFHLQEAAQLAQRNQSSVNESELLLLKALVLEEEHRDAEAEGTLLNLVSQPKLAPSFQWEADNTLADLYAQTGRSRLADLWFERAIATFHRQRISLRSVELKLPFLENGSDLYLRYMEHLIRTGRSTKALRVLDQSRAETLSEGLGVATGNAEGPFTSLQQLARRLRATLMVYCLRPNKSYLWASNGLNNHFYSLAGSNVLLPVIAQHTGSILASKDLIAQREGASGRELYKALVEPAELLIRPEARVLIIADKELSGLNFETLISSRGGAHYWIEDVTVTNARSLRMLAASLEHRQESRKQNILLMGDPVYRADEYSALPNAGREMTQVASHFAANRRSVFSALRATPQLYASRDARRFSYIHFVAHATASEINPLDSAIILSASNSSTSNKLYAHDVLNQPLQADLVTISSCNSSGKRAYSGEGAVGLVWAFLRAGAHFVVGSMWEVSDASTPQLMDTFYTQLLSGKRPDAALRSAKLSLLHDEGIFRKPLYWATFQLYAGR